MENALAELEKVQREVKDSEAKLATCKPADVLRLSERIATLRSAQDVLQRRAADELMNSLRAAVESTTAATGDTNLKMWAAEKEVRAVYALLMPLDAMKYASQADFDKWLTASNVEARASYVYYLAHAEARRANDEVTTAERALYKAQHA